MSAQQQVVTEERWFTCCDNYNLTCFSLAAIAEYASGRDNKRCIFMKGFNKVVCLILFALISKYTYAQPGSSVDLDKDKPKKYENRRLGSEKTGEKKFGFGRRLYQNTITHFNYYFNANNKLNDIINNAKLAFRDDYTQPLIPFYNYSPDMISQNKSEIDSVIYHCTAGVLLHDLRNNWIDNLYMLLGKAYYFRTDYDSALATFRYVNYAFAPKDDGYDIPIGSNASNNEGEFSIATKEKTGFGRHKPSRNESFLWMSRTFIDSGELAEAGGLIQILRNDPNFPARLQTDLHEYTAYWFYKGQLYDSAAFHLSKALNNAANKQEKSRWEFLIAQLYENAGKKEDASYWYGKAAEHTSDPILEVYANLNSVKLSKSTQQDVIQEKINNLLRLARKEKYATHRDIIYYAIAQAELERNNYTEAMKDLQKSVQTSVDNPQQKNMSFLLGADICYDTKKYDLSYALYDSIDVLSLKKEIDRKRVDERKDALKIVTDNNRIVYKEDSLQKIALMPVADRDALIKKVLKQLQKARGIKEENTPGNENVNPAVRKEGTADLFTTKGSDWYFNNISLKSSGANEFKQKWGNRPNEDNWRRKADLNKITAQQNQAAKDNANGDTLTAAAAADTTTLSFDAMLAALPLKDDQLKASNDKIAKAMFNVGKAFQDNLEEYAVAIENYEGLNQRFPAHAYKEETLFNLVYCYSKTGRTYSADSAKAALSKEFKDGKFNKSLTEPKVAVIKESSEKNPATQKYKEIYDSFIAGDFEKAEKEKKAADSIYGKSYWTPQLLYIEAIYHVSEHQDSAAINRLKEIEQSNPSSPLAEKAKTMIDVLHRRKEIESYLANLEIKRYSEDESSPVVNLQESKVVNQAPLKRADSVISTPVSKPKTVQVKIDTSAKAPTVTAVKSFEFNASDPQYVLVAFSKVAQVFVNEAKNAFNRFNKEKYYNQKIDISSVKVSDSVNLMLAGPFADAVKAIDYIDKAKPLTQGRIMPWLTPDKYNYFIISQSNLDLLKENKDMEGYKKVLQKAIPGKF